MVQNVYQSNQLDFEKEYWKQLARSYDIKIQELEKKVNSLIKSEYGINIQNIKVNNIQSGAAFNIAEQLYCSTKSDMDMDLGPNSMNTGDFNNLEHMENLEPWKVKLLPPQTFK